MSMSDKDALENYTYLRGRFENADDVFSDRLRYLCKKINAFLAKHDVADKFIVNKEILYIMILDYFVDIARLKDFHEIEKVNEAKRIAYSAFWFLRKHPIQIVKDVPKEFLYINEKFILTTITPAIIKNKHVTAKEEEYIIDFNRHLMYHFKHRNFDAQTIESMIVGFETGLKL